ncbi:MAG: FimV/HubP family polar landmark protein [Pseudomonadota bacterium]
MNNVRSMVEPQPLFRAGRRLDSVNPGGRVFAALLLVGSLIIPHSAFAVSLGTLSVNSQLGQPLDLEVELNSVDDGELATMTVGLASRSDFARAGVPYPQSAAFLKFDIIPGTSGDYFVSISSDNPINDTFLHILLSAQWAGGKVVREYTALLDPPLYSGDSAATVNVPTTDSPSEQVASEAIGVEPVDDSQEEPAGTTGGPEGTVTVQRGDTLSSIVSGLNRPSSVTMFQGLTAIQNANPDAFINGNMNRLREGAVLQIPSFDDMAALGQAQATRNFASQLNEYNDFLARIGALEPPVVDEAEEPEQVEPLVSEDVEPLTAVEEEDIAAVEVPEIPLTDLSELEEEGVEDDEARLSIGQETAEALDGIGIDDVSTEQVDALRDQLAELDASLLASGVESDEVKSRLEAIQAQVERVSRLLDVEDTGLALTQDVLSETEDDLIGSDDSETPAIEAGGESELVSTEAEVEAVTDEEIVAADDELTSSETSATETETDGSAAAEVAAVENAADDVESEETVEDDTPTRQVVSGSGILDSAKDILGGATGFLSNSLGSVGGVLSSVSDYALKVAAGLIALLAGLFIYRRRKSRREFEESMLDIESEQVTANSDLSGASLQRLSKSSGVDLASSDSALELTIGGGMSFLSEEGVTGVAEEENEVIQAGVVDPLAEADVYLAYDRDEQAIQVLKEAYDSHPEREELAEKLLEIYHKQDDRRAFDALASELRSRMGASPSSSWHKVMDMGREISPENPIYQSESDTVSFDMPDMLELDTPAEENPLVADEKPEVGLADEGISIEDFDLGDSESNDTVIRDLDEGDFEMPEIEDAKPDPVDAPTLSQIIQAAEERDRPVEEALIASVAADETETEDEELALQDLELNLGEDELDLEIKPETTKEKDSLQSITGEIGDAVDMTDIDALDEDSYLSEASEQSIGKLEPYHESETALELAKAYIELGEKDIAKGFIEEVINEGSDKQKEKAEQLVKSLID